MERLIVRYSVGDGCTYACDVVKPLEYSSKEQAKLDFGSLILEHQQTLEKHQEAYAKWNNRFHSLSSPEKRAEALKEQPRYPTVLDFKFGGQTFSFSDFFEYNYNAGKNEYVINEPDFMTIDEWFSYEL